MVASLVPVWREDCDSSSSSHFMLQLSSGVISQPGQQESELAAAGTTNIPSHSTLHTFCQKQGSPEDQQADHSDKRISSDQEGLTS